MDEASLALAVKVSRFGGITAAARDLGLSPAAASIKLMALERSMGTQLFDRTTRAVSLTADGEAFLPFAAAAQEAMAGARAAPETLRITAPGSFARAHLTPLIPAFLAKHPGVRLDLRLPDAVLDRVEGSFDLAVRDTPLATAGLIARKLAADPQLLVATSRVAATAALSSPDDLAQAPCVVVGRHDRWRFAKGCAVSVDPVLRVDNGEAALMVAQAGVGIAMLSTWLAGPALRDGRLVPVLAASPLADEGAIWAVHPSGCKTPPRTDAMIDFLVEHLAIPPWPARSA